ncbi:hypothetical protein H9Q69_000313 [Fusarium xylarioides]|uniref:Uncharacterized protein n=1 Tax=Fusarium xylarioides TaxID=221167 RepID=A0A9P7LEI2_9HYPO|nr:hypothetical protein H9Q70_008653 [Fusarium xylarioides]KAG5769329.1 hypothetical protein H9Q72_003423 [Fusarium xylarioides]KAG5800754.1 hypothetical protein H9Q69_000313 [Fusarium xylarioides]KAG5804207.1 hypothetical protein H9Q71_011216 [Fusarium xylarioides]KAG5825012.1 hypothetical protein H9Q74_004903 [Fusarium xylarioides]
MAPSTVSEGSEAAVPAPFDKIGNASVQIYFQRIRKACGKWPWELFDEKRLSPHWTVYLLQKLHQAIKLAQSSPKISLPLVMKHLESIVEKGGSLPRNGDGDGAKSSDATLVHDKIVVAPSPSPPPRPRASQNDNRDVATPPFIDLTKSDSPEPLGNEVTETRPTGYVSRVKKRKIASEVAAGSVPAPKRQKKSSKPIHTATGTPGASYKDVRNKDITDDENAHISQLNSKTIATRNEADYVHAQQTENEKRLEMLESSQQLLQQELNTAQTDLNRIRQDIQDSTRIRDSILRIIQRRTSENVDGWNIALERCDKSLKIFKDDAKKTTDLLNKKRQDLKNVVEMVGLAKRAIETCAQQAKKLAAQLEELTRSKPASDVL